MQLLAYLGLATMLLAGAPAPSKTSQPFPRKQASAQQVPNEISPQILQRQVDLTLGFATQRALPKGITRPQRALAFRLVRDLRAKRDAEAKAKWKQLAHQLGAAKQPVDVLAVINWVIRESYMQSNNALAVAADKVRFFNEQKKAIRSYIQELRDTLEEGDALEVPTLKLLGYRFGGTAYSYGPAVGVTKEQIEELIRDWEQKLQSLEEDGQMANLDLQNALQKQQQAMQMLSNLSKQMHETANSIINNMK